MTSFAEMKAIDACIRQLAAALGSASLYNTEHPQTVKHTAIARDTLSGYLECFDELLLAMVDGELLFRGKPLGISAHVARLLRSCAATDVGHVRFSKGIGLAELQQLVRVLNGEASRESLESVCEHIVVGGADVREDEADTEPIPSYEDMSRELKDGVQQQFERMAEGAAMDLNKISSLVAGLVSAFRQEANPFLALVPLRQQDEYTFTHSLDVGILNLAQGMALGIDGQLLHDIGVAGMLHDAGKVFVDHRILNKPGKLDHDELEVIRQHPALGAQYLLNQDGIPKLAVFSAYEHHMRFDLSGYPKPPSGWQLNLCSQMTMISDTFDALRTSRSYKGSWDFAKASGLMLELAGSQLNPALTFSFLRLLAQMGEGPDDEPITQSDDADQSEFTNCGCGVINPRCE